MARRRNRRKKQRGGGPKPADRVAAAKTPPAAKATAAPTDTAEPGLVPWRVRMASLRAVLRDWSRLRYAEAIDAWLRQRFDDPDAVEHADDIDQAIDDFLCSAGSSGDEPSILSVWCTQAANGQLADDEGGAADAEDVAQVRRWERERYRGVFVLQAAKRDQLSLWDPLEGAPLTLHLLVKLDAAEAEALKPGAIVTAVYQPWMARLVAVGVEYFTDPRAMQLFREQTLDAERAWHDAPTAAPTKKRTNV